MTLQYKIDKILPVLEEWEKLQKSVDNSYNSFYKLTCSAPDSPLWESVHRVSEAYTRALSKTIGDVDGWLSWYQFECDMGNASLSVDLSLNEDEVELVEVDSLEKLAYVICWGEDE